MKREYTDRYDALGIVPPPIDKVCDGQCEGTGVVPIDKNEIEPVFKRLWEMAEKKEHAEDGWHFVRCPNCHGTGYKLRPSEN